jgi:hypothetical protein
MAFDKREKTFCRVFSRPLSRSCFFSLLKNENNPISVDYKQKKLFQILEKLD